MNLKELEQRARNARQNFEVAQGKLYRGDGEPIYAEAEMKERIRELRSRRNQELDAVEQAVEEKRLEASDNLQSLEDGSPVAWLSAEELEHAAPRQAVIAADVASLDTDALRQRLRGVAHSGERSSQLGYYLAARGRAKSGDLETSKLLEELWDAAIPNSHRQKVEAARTQIREARGIKGIVYLARREQTYAYEPNLAVSGPQRAG